MDQPRKNVLKDKSYAFALRTIKLSKHLAAKEGIRTFKTSLAVWDVDRC